MLKKMCYAISRFFIQFLGHVTLPLFFTFWCVLLVDSCWNHLDKHLLAVYSGLLTLLLMLYLLRHLQGWIPKTSRQGSQKSYWTALQTVSLSLIALLLIHMYAGFNEHMFIYKIGIWYLFPMACIEILLMKSTRKKTEP